MITVLDAGRGDRIPDRYIDLVGRGASPVASGEHLDAPTRRTEGLQLALRTRHGVPLEAIDGDQLHGLLERAGDRWVLTRRGRLLANEVSTRLT